MTVQWAEWLSTTTHMLAKEPDSPRLPPGTGPMQHFEGPWFSTQLILSLFIGVTSVLAFCFLRTRWDLVYMGRTKLKDFAPSAAHSPDALHGGSFFGWIMPTLRTSEFTVLQTVGLDAAVLLNFYRMAFVLFSLLAFLAAVVLMPLNLFRHGSTDIDDGNSPNGTDPSNSTIFSTFAYLNSTTPLPRQNTTAPALVDVLLDPQTSATINILFTYLFTILVLVFLHRNFHKFVQSRQAFSLHLIHSISARTILVTNLPSHLQGDKVLADYFENCKWSVESVSVCREVEPLRRVLERRTDALLKLENAWADWVGNPAKGVTGYDPDFYAKRNRIARSLTASPQRSEAMLVDIDDDDNEGRGQRSQSGLSTTSDVNGSRDVETGDEDHCHVHTTRPRPTFRPRWFGAKVDAIEFWEKKYKEADEKVRSLRKKGKFEASQSAFVTFEHVKDAQMACQVVHYPHHSQVITEPAPEPRDVVWGNIGMTQRQTQIRGLLGLGIFAFIFLFWIPPVFLLSGILSYAQIKKSFPWLAKIIKSSPRLRAIIQNSFPSLAIMIFNGLLPFLLTWVSLAQGVRSRSAVEYSMMKKYHIMLLATVLFLFLLTTTLLALIRDLAGSPARIPEKLATALLGSNVRNFMISYVMLQALGLMPLQLLNLGPLLSLGWSRLTACKTPRDYAEANAPPMLNYGWVYPQSLLIFTLTLVFSVVSPLILVFGAIYFGASYLVYKYKLLFIYFKPYESNGEAWRITFVRLLWALVLFQLFMTGLFSLRQPYWPSLAMFPLIAFTLWWSWVMYREFTPLSEYLALSSICEVTRGGDAEEVVGVRDEASISRSQANLNHRRYAVNDETLYVAPSDKRTDYSQPPMSGFYYGVLNTGRRRYAHPALSGSLPFPWLPSIARPRAFGDGAAERRGVVLSLRRKMAKKLKKSQEDDDEEPNAAALPDGWTTGVGYNDDQPESSDNLREPTDGRDGRGMSSSQLSSASNPWRDPTPTPPGNFGNSGVRKKSSWDPATRTGNMDIPDEANVWGADPSSESDNEGDHSPGPAASPSTYFHHPERRRTVSGSDKQSNGDGAA